jgi:4-amino-4-deoxy-L-arabinose transferase-like glycosyltransferase
VLVALPFMLYRTEFKAKISRFWLFIVATSAIVIPVLVFTYFSGTLGQWLNLMQISDTATNLYSFRFPQPIFYILELIQSLYFVHPISLLVLVLGLNGLAFFIWRRKTMDKFLVIWFVVIYVVFTLITTKSWRYVMPLAPVIAIASASFISFLYDKMQHTWRSAHFNLDTKWMAKFLSGLLIFFTVTAVVTNATEAYDWIARFRLSIPVPTSHPLCSRQISC